MTPKIHHVMTKMFFKDPLIQMMCQTSNSGSLSNFFLQRNTGDPALPNNDVMI